jgi:hypothetical protein
MKIVRKLKVSHLLLIIVKFFLLSNLVIVSILFVTLLGSIVYDGVKTNFDAKPISVSVALMSDPKDIINIQTSDKIVFLRGKTGEADLKLPFAAQLVVPLSFLPIFNVSPLNLFFYILTYFNLFLVLHNISKEKPFLDRNKKRLKWLGASYIAWGIALLSTNALIDKTVREISENHLRFNGNFLTNYIEIGLVVFIIAMVYARGIEMEKEAALTI